MMTLLSPLLLLRANSPTTMIKSRRSLLLLRALKRDVMRFENEEKRSNDGDEFKKKCTKKVPLKRRPRVRERIHLRYYYVLVPRIKQKRGVARIRAHIQQFKKIRSTTRGVSFGRGTPRSEKISAAVDGASGAREAFKSLPPPPHLANNTITLASAIDKAVFFDIPANLLSFAKPLMARTHPQMSPFKFMDHPPSNASAVVGHASMKPNASTHLAKSELSFEAQKRLRLKYTESSSWRIDNALVSWFIKPMIRLYRVSASTKCANEVTIIVTKGNLSSEH